MPSDNHVKVLFRLAPNEDGYPPVAVEGLWTRHGSDGALIVDNIPFFVRGISSGDEVVATEVDGELWFESILKMSGNSTFRIIPEDSATVDAIRDEVAGLGGVSEINRSLKLLAIEIPAESDIHAFLDYLMIGREEGVFDFEEGALRHEID